MSRLALGLTLTPLALSGAAPISVSIDPARTGAPINPHIYGQFIEHLGRCIYGGIWAEMLEDRKFYFPITADYAPYRSLEDSNFPVVGASPWQIIGDADGVTMTTTAGDVFVGQHSPRLRAGTGLRQRDLGVRAGIACAGYLWAKPASGRAEVEVTFIWGEAAHERATQRLTFTGREFSKKNITFTPTRTVERGALLEIRAVTGDLVLGPPSLMPADNVRGLRRDTLALLKQLDGTVYRWPGGNFVSGYDWRDGIGDRDRRPPRKNPAWTGVEHNDFGTDDFIAFCRELGTEPMIALNTGFGDAYSAAQWVEYCNSAASTLAGGWRAGNGHRQPYGVKYWCVGNEMWGPFQLGYMQLHHYVLKHNTVVEAVRKVDPSLVLVGVGDIDTINRANDPQQAQRGIVWSHGMLETCADHMDMISEHFYSGRVPWRPEDGRVDLAAHVGLVKDAIRKKVEGHRKLQPSLPNLRGRTIPIAMDEWNYWHRDYAYGELGCIYELQDGLGIAAGLHEFYRQSDIIHMAHYAQTVNVIGAIKTTRIAAEMETTGLVLQLYRAHYGRTPLVLEQDFAPYDVAAALSADGKTLTVSVVNPTESAVDLALNFGRARSGGAVTRWHITGPDKLAHNTPGQPRVVDIARTDNLAADAPLAVPALSCSLFAIPLQ